LDLKVIGREGVDWINVAQDRGLLADSCGQGNEPAGSIKGKKILGYLSELLSSQ
jgi:hypothetical protein